MDGCVRVRGRQQDEFEKNESCLHLSDTRRAGPIADDVSRLSARFLDILTWHRHCLIASVRTPPYLGKMNIRNAGTTVHSRQFFFLRTGFLELTVSCVAHFHSHTILYTSPFPRLAAQCPGSRRYLVHRLYT